MKNGNVVPPSKDQDLRYKEPPEALSLPRSEVGQDEADRPFGESSGGQLGRAVRRKDNILWNNNDEIAFSFLLSYRIVFPLRFFR